MHAHDRTVDHLHAAVVRFDDSAHQAIPDTGFPPAVEAIVGRRVRPVALGQISPWCASAEDPEDAIENSSIVLRLRPAPIHGQQGFDNAPLEVGQIVAHDPSPDVSKLESLFADLRYC